MGSKSKNKRPRQVDFASGMRMLSDMSDQKVLQYTKEFTSNLASIKVRIEALEDLIIEKLGETQDSFQERVMLRVEKNFGYEPVDTEIKKGSIVRLKIKEEEVGKESDSNPMDNQYICVGHNQLDKTGHIDDLVVGARAGETRNVTLPDPKDANIQRKITVLISKVFKGEEAKYETKTEEVTTEPKQAVS